MCHLFSPAVYHNGMKTDDALKSIFGFEDVVDAIAIGGEGIGKFKFAFCEVQHKGFVLRIIDGVAP